MLYTILLSLVVGISLPAMAHAQIYSHTTATADSGGNVAGPGGTVTTGNSSASVQVHTTTSSSGTSSVYIKTDVNGTVHEETVPTRGATDVSVEATPTKTTTDVKEGTPPTVVRHTVVPAASSSASDEGSSSAPAAAQPSTTAQEGGLGLGAQIVLAVQNFFAGIFSWFK